MNETKWNFNDDEFFIINKKWFEKWKYFVQYDYIVSHVMTQKKPMKDLSINKLMSNGADPESITNKFLLVDSKDYYHNRSDTHVYTNYPIKEDFFIGRDYLIVSKAVWKILHGAY